MQSVTSRSNLNLSDLLLNSRTPQSEPIDRVIQRISFQPLSEDRLVQLLKQVLTTVNDQQEPQFRQKLQEIALNSLKLFTGKNLYDEQNKTWRWEESKLISEQRKAVLEKMLRGESFSSKEEVIAQLNTIFRDLQTQKKSPLGLSILVICLILFPLAIVGILPAKPKLVSDTPTPQTSVSNTPVNCAQGQDIVAIACELPVSDADITDFNSGTLTFKIKKNGQPEDRILIFGQNLTKNDITLRNQVIGNYTGGEGTTPLVVTFNSNAKIQEVKDLLKLIVYKNSAETPQIGDRLIEIELTDGDGATSNPITKVINVNKINQTPTIKISFANQTATEDQQLVIAKIQINDSDAGQEIIDVTLKANQGRITVKNNVEGGLGANNISNNNSKEVTLSGKINQINNTLKTDKAIVYQPLPNYSGNDYLDITVNDKGKKTNTDGKIIYPPNALAPQTSNQSIAIAINSVNDPPILGTRFSQEEAITLIKDWLDKGKNGAFGNYNEQIVLQYTTGKYQARNLKTIRDLKRDNSYLNYSPPRLTPVSSLVVKGNQATIKLNVQETYYHWRYNTSRPYFTNKTFNFTLQKISEGNWKIADVN